MTRLACGCRNRVTPLSAPSGRGPPRGPPEPDESAQLVAPQQEIPRGRCGSLWGSRTSHTLLSSGDRWPSALGHDRRCVAAAVVSALPASAEAGRADWAARPPPRTSNCSCCGTRSPYSAAPTHDHGWTGRTGPCSPPSSGGCPEHCAAIAWSPRTRSCAGIAALCARSGPTRTAPVIRRSATCSRFWSCGWRRITRTGDTKGSRAS
jgi:hypothetical protein